MPPQPSTMSACCSAARCLPAMLFRCREPSRWIRFWQVMVAGRGEAIRLRGASIFQNRYLMFMVLPPSRCLSMILLASLLHPAVMACFIFGGGRGPSSGEGVPAVGGRALSQTPVIRRNIRRQQPCERGSVIPSRVSSRLWRCHQTYQVNALSFSVRLCPAGCR